MISSFPLTIFVKPDAAAKLHGGGFWFCRQNKHHKLKILMFFTAMRAYRDELQRQGFEVCYHAVDTDDFADSFEEKLERIIVSNEIREIHHFEIEDHFFSQRIRQFISASELKRVSTQVRNFFVAQIGSPNSSNVRRPCGWQVFIK